MKSFLFTLILVLSVVISTMLSINVNVVNAQIEHPVTRPQFDGPRDRFDRNPESLIYHRDMFFHYHMLNYTFLGNFAWYFPNGTQEGTHKCFVQIYNRSGAHCNDSTTTTHLPTNVQTYLMRSIEEMFFAHYNQELQFLPIANHSGLYQSGAGYPLHVGKQFPSTTTDGNSSIHLFITHLEYQLLDGRRRDYTDELEAQRMVWNQHRPVSTPYKYLMQVHQYGNSTYVSVDIGVDDHDSVYLVVDREDHSKITNPIRLRLLKADQSLTGQFIEVQRAIDYAANIHDFRVTWNSAQGYPSHYHWRPWWLGAQGYPQISWSFSDLRLGNLNAPPTSMEAAVVFAIVSTVIIAAFIITACAWSYYKKTHGKNKYRRTQAEMTAADQTSSSSTGNATNEPSSGSGATNASGIDMDDLEMNNTSIFDEDADYARRRQKVIAEYSEMDGFRDKMKSMPV